ncbi:MAG: EscU/YscU/HrcU family type III secretion system export apparatus switch protein [Puniceicoccaceae bacterium]|nr:MAG: EscU/YscU/HrcU family type III secretion system export apparatus switch protein [Puniceicoccaceae bacterium]
MADQDKASKTEEPTEKRIKDAFEEGQFAKSPEIQVAFGLGAGFLVLLFAGPTIGMRVGEIGQMILGSLAEFEVNRDSLGMWTRFGIGEVMQLVMPITLAAVVAGVVSGGLQSGFQLSPKALEVKWEKMNPASGFKRLVSADVLVRFGIDLLKLIAVVGILLLALRRVMQDPIFHSAVDIRHVGNFILDTALYVLVRVLLATAVIAAISYFYQKQKTRKDLRMTRDEVKRERKNAEGDPHVKSAQRAMARRLLVKQMLSAVPTADVVVTNPTHFAVALKYEQGVDRAPVVLARGENLFAQRIKELARRHGVPMVENRPLARMLYKYGRVRKEIPAQLYQAVAEILAFVYRTHRYYFHRLRARRLAERQA